MELNIPGYTPPPKSDQQATVFEQSSMQDDTSSSMELNIPGYTLPPKPDQQAAAFKQSCSHDDKSSSIVAEHDSQLGKETGANPGITRPGASTPEPAASPTEESSVHRRSFERPSDRRADTEPPDNAPTNRPSEPRTTSSVPPGVLLSPSTVETEGSQQPLHKPTPEELFAKVMGADIFQVISKWRYLE